MAGITMRKLSQETKEQLRQRASRRRCSLEALERSILDAATVNTEQNSNFPHDLISQVEPGEDIEPYLQDHDQPATPPDLR